MRWLVRAERRRLHPGIFVFSLGATRVAWAQIGLAGTVVGCVDASGKIRAAD